ncbi:MAG: aminopeptidase [Bacilli bacterium]|nr:aminopeptidase [Bacilli bacterium]
MEKTKGEILEEKLFNECKNGFEGLDENKKEVIFKFSDDYINFLNKAKTERLFTKETIKLLDYNGFKDIFNVKEIKPGDKIYYVNRSKAVYAAVIGEDKLSNGLNLIGAHIDSPRLDLKPNPLYEDGGFALFKTHYYGGIKKYQWTTIPLAIHGVVVKSSGEVVDINIGEEDTDPVFTITDLLPHLAKDQMKKTLSDGIAGEDLNLLVGSIPYEDEKVSEKVKLNILSILNKKYGITERDFNSAELELVPAFKARSLGFDESMVAAYGQDDKSCAYTSLRALLDLDKLQRTAVLLLTDKEEIGSMGNTGMYSANFEHFVSLLLEKTLEKEFNCLNKCLCNSEMLSADVTSASDPTYDFVDEKNNAAYLGRGLCLIKYTGGRGKSGASDASAEFVAKVRDIFESNDLLYQISDMGKIDVGGGGTIAYILADRGIDVLDAGIPVLSMHAPYEVASKFDIYNAYECYKAFFED